MKYIFLIFMLIFSLNAGKLTYNGLLDDDLFLISSNRSGSHLDLSLQMHNPDRHIIYDGKVYESILNNGVVNISRKLKKDSNYAVFLANERDEIYNDFLLHKRSHYRSKKLYYNNKVLIPEISPTTYPDFPHWFRDFRIHGKSGCSFTDEVRDEEDYLVLWENATVAVGLILEAGIYNIYFESENKNFNLSNVVVTDSQSRHLPLIKGNNLKESNLMTFEKTGKLKSYIEEVKKSSVSKIIAYNQTKKVSYVFKLIYPWVYLNNFYIIGH